MNLPDNNNNMPAFPVLPVLLVDGDIVAYRAAAAAEKTKYCITDSKSLCTKCDSMKDVKAWIKEWSALIDPEHFNPEVWSRKEVQPESHALQCLDSTMDAISKRFETCQTIKVFLSGERNFRDQVWRTKKYKGNRNQERPKHLESVRCTLVDRYAASISVGQEADDDIGIAANDSTVVVSTDKDLDQIPGWHYNWVNEELYWVSEEDAEKFFWEQVIAGDPTDNVPGLPGWGPVKAREFIDAADPDATLGPQVEALFNSLDFSTEYFLEMVDLIMINRNHPND